MQAHRQDNGKRRAQRCSEAQQMEDPMSFSTDTMPPLVRNFVEAVCRSPADQAWLRVNGHALIDSLIEPDGGSAAMVLEILRLMRDNLLGDGNWGSLIWDHDLVAKVIAATGLRGELG